MIPTLPPDCYVNKKYMDLAFRVAENGLVLQRFVTETKYDPVFSYMVHDGSCLGAGDFDKQVAGVIVLAKESGGKGSVTDQQLDNLEQKLIEKGVL